LRALTQYGGPKELAADEAVRERLAEWSQGMLSAAKAEELLAGAKRSNRPKSG
jgi:hypothetical protein